MKPPPRIRKAPTWCDATASTLLAGLLWLGVGWTDWLTRESEPSSLPKLRRWPAGHYQECGYDRSGLAKGAKCPECGTLAPAARA